MCMSTKAINQGTHHTSRCRAMHSHKSHPTPGLLFHVATHCIYSFMCFSLPWIKQHFKIKIARESEGSSTFRYPLIFKVLVSYNLWYHLTLCLGKCKWSKFFQVTVMTVQISFIHTAKSKGLFGDGFEVKLGLFSKCKVFLDFTPSLYYHIHLHLPSR